MLKISKTDFVLILCFFRNQARCPNDQTPLSAKQLFQDRSARREVLDLKVVCSNQDCKFISELRNIQASFDWAFLFNFLLLISLIYLK